MVNLNWQKYPVYKSSGVEWLGDIPEHWEVKKIRFIAKVNRSKSETHKLSSNTLVSFLPMENLGVGNINLKETRKIEEVREGYTYFRDGDVIVAKITPCFENGKIAVCKNLKNGIGFGTTELHVICSNNLVNPEFLFYCLSSKNFISIGSTRMYGTAGQKRISDDFIKDFKLPLPPLSEQQAIANFLDEKTAQIDEYIAKKQRIIELLKEQKTVIINQAVTKGINPDVTMKYSGVEWLGEIPEHWEIIKGKRIFKRMNRPTLNSDEVVTAFRDGTVTLRKNRRVEGFTNSLLEIGYQGVKKGDLVIHAMDAFAGAIGVSDSDGKATPVYSVCQPILDVNCYYYGYLLKQMAYSGYIVSLARGIRERSTDFRYREFANLPLPFPPLSEQQAIANFLDDKLVKIDKCITVIEKEIKLTQEYRTSLISETVTGKIDVRKYHPPQ